MRAISYSPLILVLAVVSACVTIASLFVGYAAINVFDAISDLLAGRNTMPALVLMDLRLPRALLGAAIGFTLGLAGAAMQGLFRNPLADPGIVGVSGGAALGAVIVFYSGLASLFILALPIGGIIGAIMSACLLYGIAGRGAGTKTLILAGVTINSFTAALTTLALNLSTNPYAAYEVMFWLMGSLVDRSMPQFVLVIVPIIIGCALLLSSAKALDALSLGEETAASLGFDLQTVRIKLIAGTTLAVGAAVAVSGAIGFLGLVAPHIMRPLVGHRPGRLLLASGFAGAIGLVLADMAVRLLPFTPEIHLGVVMALIGAPFLFSLVGRTAREEG